MTSHVKPLPQVCYLVTFAIVCGTLVNQSGPLAENEVETLLLPSPNELERGCLGSKI